MGAKSGRKKPTQAQANASKKAGAKRFALVVFGALFIALFVIFAVAQGIGETSVPEGDVAVVKDVPDGNLSEADFKRSFAQQAAGAELKKVPKPGTKKYEELTTSVMTELLQSVWLRGEAEELDISVTDKQVYLQGDGSVQLQDLMKVIDQLKDAGVSQVAIVAKAPGDI